LQSPKCRFHTVICHFKETVDIVRQEYDDDDNNSFVFSDPTKYFWQTAFHFIGLGCKSLYLQAKILV